MQGSCAEGKECQDPEDQREEKRSKVCERRATVKGGLRAKGERCYTTQVSGPGKFSENQASQPGMHEQGMHFSPASVSLNVHLWKIEVLPDVESSPGIRAIQLLLHCPLVWIVFALICLGWTNKYMQMDMKWRGLRAGSLPEVKMETWRRDTREDARARGPPPGLL